VESRRLNDADELRAVLRETFGIDDSGLTGLDGRFAGLA
jgi:hypothetical protein